MYYNRKKYFVNRYTELYIFLSLFYTTLFECHNLLLSLLLYVKSNSLTFDKISSMKFYSNFKFFAYNLRII